MSLQPRRLFGLLLLALSLVAASSAPTEPPPVFLTKWGQRGFDPGQFYMGRDIAVGEEGAVYVLDFSPHRVQKFDSSGQYLTQFGGYGTTEGKLNQPYGLGVDASGNVYVADYYNFRLQKFDSNGTFLIMWGWGVDTGASAFETCTLGCQAGVQGSGDGQFSWPNDVAVDLSGNVYVADSGNNRIQKFNNSGTYITQWGTSCDVGGSGVDGCDGDFNYPTGVALDDSDNIYVVGRHNHRVQKFDSVGNFLAKWGTEGTGDGQFSHPRKVAVNASGDVYVADAYNDRIQKFDSSGTFLTKWGTTCITDDVGVDACDGNFDWPMGVAVDDSGNVYTIEDGNDRVQKFGGPWLKFFIGEPEPPSGH